MTTIKEKISNLIERIVLVAGASVLAFFFTDNLYLITLLEKMKLEIFIVGIVGLLLFLTGFALLFRKKIKDWLYALILFPGIIAFFLLMTNFRNYYNDHVKLFKEASDTSLLFVSDNVKAHITPCTDIMRANIRYDDVDIYRCILENNQITRIVATHKINDDYYWYVDDVKEALLYRITILITLFLGLLLFLIFLYLDKFRKIIYAWFGVEVQSNARMIGGRKKRKPKP